jgi:Ca2+-binding RTX toxin-like protein
LNVFLGNYTLAANVENARISGAGNFDVTGNGLDNKIVGNEANNLIAGKAGADQLNGGLGDDTLEGNAGDDTIFGGSGNDYINGGVGRDVLHGDAGSDVFTFSNQLGAANVDQVEDFSVPDDTISLENSIFSALATGTLAASNFRIGTAAVDGNDHIIYNATTGALFYDEDGSGGVAQVRFAMLSTGLLLTSADFVVF